MSTVTLEGNSVHVGRGKGLNEVSLSYFAGLRGGASGVEIS